MMVKAYESLLQQLGWASPLVLTRRREHGYDDGCRSTGLMDDSLLVGSGKGSGSHSRGGRDNHGSSGLRLVLLRGEG